MTIRPDMTIVRSPTCLAAEVGDEVVVMSVERGLYYAFDEISSDIWGRIAEPLSVQSLCQALLLDYDAAPEVIEGDVLAVLTRLREAGLVDVVG
ncbi:PqqD family protein [Paramagnetospirillum magneticum]|uniref:Coenzyme PQQ synthesis protein D n=1 Tax=Paramagnetospirillum magneticum (strain ATCC 700264 / AMB-1) TaxID=342108 RepID=Q2W7A8_PARM1|nr:PqqD family protein [Paramagnetospirillum magneticum]BAE50267.1 hypothetical protein amb1463 [Paramagnetospirillum magneticum AMB-1]